VAKKDSKAKNASSNATKVTRITASDETQKKSKTSKTHILSSQEKADQATARQLEKSDDAPTKREIAAQKREKQSTKRRNPLAAMGGYFKGAWYELRQVRWPDRSTTWQMTGALLLFCALFIGIILLLDGLFTYLFKLMIG